MPQNKTQCYGCSSQFLIHNQLRILRILSWGFSSLGMYLDTYIHLVLRVRKGAAQRYLRHGMQHAAILEQAQKYINSYHPTRPDSGT